MQEESVLVPNRFLCTRNRRQREQRIIGRGGTTPHSTPNHRRPFGQGAGAIYPPLHRLSGEHYRMLGRPGHETEHHHAGSDQTCTLLPPLLSLLNQHKFTLFTSAGEARCLVAAACDGTAWPSQNTSAGVVARVQRGVAQPLKPS